eukprot:scaffold6486_cov96-Cylindrotheca_fusiformis.AAC.12
MMIFSRRLVLVGSKIIQQHHHHHHQKCRRFSTTIGRMIDMGGMPNGSSTDNNNSYGRVVNASKNSKLQAVAFDFEALTNSIHESGAAVDDDSDSNSTTTTASSSTKKLQPVQPDMAQVQQVASLLNVKVPGGTNNSSSTTQQPSTNPPPRNDWKSSSAAHEDVRAKYAKKLKGGLTGIQSVKSQVEESLAKSGDAAGHLAAREMAMNTAAGSPTKWMAMTGTGVLLSYLTHRSIKIALLPNPTKLNNVEQREHQQDAMEALKRQLKGIVIDCIVDLKEEDSGNLQTSIEKNLIHPLDVHPNATLLVTDRDDYLKAAKDAGMLTCRIQKKKNARRGNITAHYNTPSIPDVKEVVNEINGISFNAVLNR